MSSQTTPSPSLSTTTTSPSPISDEEKPALPPPLKPELPSELDPPPQLKRTTVFPSREDCWSEDATRTLIGAWGSNYLELNRGNLRQNHWQAVAESVNALHATTAKLHRTDVQCKNRIDTIKKKYKIEKSKTLQSNGRHVSTWPLFKTLDSLIGGSFSKPNNNTSANRHSRNPRRKISQSPESSPFPPPPPAALAPLNLLRDSWSVPVGPRSKRCGPGNVTKRNFSVMAAAAAALEAEGDELDDDEGFGRKIKRREEEEGKSVWKGGYRMLAEAICRLGTIYEKVEVEKQRQMIELEKQRMLFLKDLEMLRMEFFMESQVLLEKL